MPYRKARSDIQVNSDLGPLGGSAVDLFCGFDAVVSDIYTGLAYSKI